MQTDVRAALPPCDGWAVGECYYPNAVPNGIPMGDIRFGVDARRYTAEQLGAALAASPQEQADPVAKIEEAFREGYFSRETYNDKDVSDVDGQWAKYKASLAASPKPAQAEPEGWQQLYRRAINEANGLTNYVEDRPELRSTEKRIAKIEEEARALAAAPKRTEG